MLVGLDASELWNKSLIRGDTGVQWIKKIVLSLRKPAQPPSSRQSKDEAIGVTISVSHLPRHANHLRHIDRRPQRPHGVATRESLFARDRRLKQELSQLAVTPPDAIDLTIEQAATIPISHFDANLIPPL